MKVFYDAPDDRMIVLEEYTGNLWSVSLEASRSEWRRLPAPSARPGFLSTSFLDPRRRRIVVMGQGGNSQPWIYDLNSGAGWTPSYPSGLPPYGRWAGSLVYDPVFDRAVLYSGAVLGPDWGMLSPRADAWSLFLDAITEEVAIDVKPFHRENVIRLHSQGPTEVAILGSPTFSVDSVVASSVILAGAAVHSRGDDGPVARRRDVNSDGRVDLVVHVETDDLQLGRDDTLATLHGSTRHGTRIVGFDRVRVVPRARGPRREEEPEPAARLFLRVRNANAPDRPLALEYGLPARGPARIEVFDILGRRVATSELVGRASHTGEIDVAGAGSLPAGVYLVRLRQGQQTIIARAAVFR